MPGGIGHEELLCGCSISTHIKEDPADAQGRYHCGIFDGAGFKAMFISHFVGIVAQLVEIIQPDLFITNINPGPELWKINIDPVRVFGFLLKKTGIPDNTGIFGIFEGIGEVRQVEGLVFMGRE